MITDIVKLYKDNKIICVTTNGFVKKFGEAVMRRGNALAMAKLIPTLPKLLGDHIWKNGNNVGFIYTNIIAFPVKPEFGHKEDLISKPPINFKYQNSIPGWACKARLSIIERSIKQLNKLIEDIELNQVYLPIPGIEAGELDIKEVGPLLRELDKRVMLISKNKIEVKT